MQETKKAEPQKEWQPITVKNNADTTKNQQLEQPKEEGVEQKEQHEWQTMRYKNNQRKDSQVAQSSSSS